MAVINRFNFETKFPEIRKSIAECTFLSLDCEFTGLLAKTSMINRLV